ncbi:hypothetical protein LTR65_003550 [Meristemomyces frigidus]
MRGKLPLVSGHPTADVATKGHHKARSSLLLGHKADTTYQPLSGSFSNTTSTSQYTAPGGYYERQGIPTTPGVGASKANGWMHLPNSTWTWSFFGISVAQCIISLALESYVFAEFQTSLVGAAKNEHSTKNRPSAALTIPTYLAIFIFGFIYELGLVWDALRLKNTIQVIGVCLYNLGMLIYAAVEMNQVDQAVGQLVTMADIAPGTWGHLRPFLIAAPCVIALGTVLLGLVAWKLYDEFAWTIYKHISADLRLKRRFLTYQIYIALLKFDFFFFLGFTVQFLVVVENTPDVEFYITIVAIPVTIALLFLAAFCVRRESKIGHGACMLVYFAAMAYFIFKLVRMYDSKRALAYKAGRPSLTTFAVLTLMLLVVTIGTAFACLGNFGKGLMPHIQKRKVPDADDLKYSGYGGSELFNGPPHQLGPVPNRMTID